MLRQRRGTLRGFQLLNLHRAAQGIDDTLKFDQQTIAHGFDQPAVMTLERRLEDVILVCLKTRAGALFVDLAQSTVTDDISDQDCCKTALHPRSFWRANVLLTISYSMSQRDAIVGPGDIQLSCDMSDKDGAGRNTSIHRHPNHQQSCQKQASVGSSFFAISRRIAGYDDSLINGAGQTRQRQDLPRLLGSDAHADPDRRPLPYPSAPSASPAAR